jgi:hypothetical protein
LSAAFFTYQLGRGEGSRFSVLAIGAVCVFGALFMGTGSRMTLEGLQPRGFNDIGMRLPAKKIRRQASPGIGIYAVGAGGLLLTLGGALLTGLAIGGIEATPVRRTKVWPDCTETVMAEAKVCRHCGRRL